MARTKHGRAVGATRRPRQPNAHRARAVDSRAAFFALAGHDEANHLAEHRSDGTMGFVPCSWWCAERDTLSDAQWTDLATAWRILCDNEIDTIEFPALLTGGTQMLNRLAECRAEILDLGAAIDHQRAQMTKPLSRKIATEFLEKLRRFYERSATLSPRVKHRPADAGMNAAIAEGRKRDWGADVIAALLFVGGAEKGALDHVREKIRKRLERSRT